MELAMKGGKENADKINEDLFDDMKENFLDTVFDQASKLSRKEYMDLVIAKAAWIFDSNEIRQVVDKKIK